MAEDYTRGEMNISEQKNTFEGFIHVSTLSGLITCITILFLAMVFGTSIGWFTSLITTLIVAGIAGVLLKQNAVYWILTGFLAVVAAISGGLVSLLAG